MSATTRPSKQQVLCNIGSLFSQAWHAIECGERDERKIESLIKALQMFKEDVPVLVAEYGDETRQVLFRHRFERVTLDPWSMVQICKRYNVPVNRIGFDVLKREHGSAFRHFKDNLYVFGARVTVNGTLVAVIFSTHSQGDCDDILFYTDLHKIVD